MSLKPATEFNREVGVKLTPGQPVFTGYAAVVGKSDDPPLIITAPTKAAVINQVAAWFPDLELDHNHIYEVALIHRKFIQTASDVEEL